MKEFFGDLFRFLSQRKKYIFAPILLVLLLLGALIVVGHGSAVSPFVYTIF